MSGGIITTIANNVAPVDLAVSAAGEVLFTEGLFVRKLSGATIMTIAGDGSRGFSGDGGPATNAQLADASGIALDRSGNVYIADSWARRVRVLTPGGPPPLSVEPAALSLSYTRGGPPPVASLFVTSNGVPVPVSATFTGGSWLAVSPSSTTTPATLTVSVDAGLSQGAYNGAITIASTGASNSPVSVPVSLQVACGYKLSSNSAWFPNTGGAGSFAVTTQSGCPWTVAGVPSWITPTPGGGSGSASVNFTAAPNPGAFRQAVITVQGQAFTISQGAWPTPPAGGLRFVPMTPCRLMETRPEYNFEGRTGAFGPPYLLAGATRTMTVASSNVCSVPSSARAYVLNVTAVPRGALDYVTVWPGGEPRPDVWTVRSPDGQIVANSAIVKAGSGAISVFASNDTDLVIDISGYFTDAVTGAANLVHYSLTPCRVLETRWLYRPFGPPTMAAHETRHLAFPATPYCSIPSGAAAYSVTLTVVPPAPLAYLTAWPTGGAQPNVSSINSFAGRTLANSVILPADNGGSIDLYAYDRTDVLIDINGYFAPDDGQNGLYYFPVTQCRVSDTRGPAGTFGGPIMEDQTTRTIPVPASNCAGIPLVSKAYALNATALPGGSPMPFLTLWPTGLPQPNASILNAFEGQTVSNSAIIPAGTSGAVNVYAYRRTHVVVEVSGYFGR